MKNSNVGIVYKHNNKKLWFKTKQNYLQNNDKYFKNNVL